MNSYKKILFNRVVELYEENKNLIKEINELSQQLKYTERKHMHLQDRYIQEMRIFDAEDKAIANIQNSITDFLTNLENKNETKRHKRNTEQNKTAK